MWVAMRQGRCSTAILCAFGMSIFRSLFSLANACIVSALVFFGIVSTSNAALLYFDPSELQVSRGDTATIGLRIDTDEDECINAVDIVIKYDPSIRAVDVSRGNSILNIWVEDPVIDETNHTITFAGGLPGGYCGRIAGDPSLTNIIAELMFRSPGFSVGTGGNTASGKIWVDGISQVLLHDGRGTQSNLRLQDATIVLLPNAGATTEDSWKDLVAQDSARPSDFVISLAREENAFSGRYFISFNSQDKQSGIDHYEVIEEPLEDFYAFKWGGADAPWVETESPYVLKDQTLNSTIRVKAIDKAGNETIAVLVPEEALRTISRERLTSLFVSVGGALLVVLVLAYILIRRKKALIKKAPEEQLYE